MNAYDVVYSVSDLHLGGPPGRQIFQQGSLFGGMCHAIAEEAKSRSLAFVVNGDVVDFLAEEDATYFDPRGAVRKLERIAGDPAFKPVFDGCREIVLAGGTVVLTVGNHDIELILPGCVAWLVDRLAGDDIAARGRVELALDGAGFRCRVGDSSAFFVHGNDWDAWNVVNHEALRAAAEAGKAGRALPRVPTSHGTRLVVDVMNPIKKTHRFVDLLKPEGLALAAILVAVDRDNLFHVGRFARLWAGRTLKKLATRGLLSEVDLDDEDGSTSEEDASRILVDRAFRAAPRDESTGALLLRTERRFRARRSSLEYTLSGEDDMLARPGIPTLRAAVDRLLRDDRAFDVHGRDDTFTAADAAVSGADFLVVGHTHLRRAMERPDGRGAYFNSGTWADLLNLREVAGASDDELDTLVQALERDDLEPHLTRLPTVVVLENDENGARGHLAEPVREAPGGRVRLQPVVDTGLCPRRSS